MNRPTRVSRHAGFTFIETLVVLVILLVLMLMSYPELAKYYNRSQLEGIARDTSLALQQGRYQAIKNNQARTVCADTANRQILVSTNAGVMPLPLPERVIFAAPIAEPVITVPGNCFTFLPDGSVQATGSFRVADAGSFNFLEIRVEPQATAKVQVRKWDDEDEVWYTRGEGGKRWTWNTGRVF